MTTTARLLDRRRLELMLGRASAGSVVAALAGYRNDDGGFGSGLEPDLRAQDSQPSAALHAFEVFAEIAPTTHPWAAELCTWLDRISLPDGGAPFALPVDEPVGCAPFWVDADPSASSLLLTPALAALALRIGRTDPAVADHPWLAKATAHCLGRIRNGAPPGHALELKFVVQFLDAAVDAYPDAHADLARIRRSIPADGRVHVVGGLADEAINALDFAPVPGTAARALFDPAIVAQELGTLRAAQCADGGWPCDWASYSPAAALEWRGWLTVRAVSILRANAAPV